MNVSRHPAQADGHAPGLPLWHSAVCEMSDTAGNVLFAEQTVAPRRRHGIA